MFSNETVRVIRNKERKGPLNGRRETLRNFNFSVARFYSEEVSLQLSNPFAGGALAARAPGPARKCKNLG